MVGHCIEYGILTLRPGTSIEFTYKLSVPGYIQVVLSCSFEDISRWTFV